MVVFTCNHCGDSVHKPKVQKHYETKCRRFEPNVTCVDCFKDFHGNEHVAHTKCVTEQERYAPKGFVPKPSQNKGEKKQIAWVEMLEGVLLEQKDISPSVKHIIQKVSQQPNTPRKQSKFENFVRNIVGPRLNSKDVTTAWNIISVKLSELSNKAKTDCNIINGNEETFSNDNASALHNDAIVNDETSSEIIKLKESVNENKGKTNKRKHTLNISDKIEDESEEKINSENNHNNEIVKDTHEVFNDVSKRVKSKKKKEKHPKFDENVEKNNIESIASVEDPTVDKTPNFAEESITTLEGKKKKKKRNSNVHNNKEDESDLNKIIENSSYEESHEQGKKKKNKNKSSNIIDNKNDKDLEGIDINDDTFHYNKILEVPTIEATHEDPPENIIKVKNKNKKRKHASNIDHDQVNEITNNANSILKVEVTEDPADGKENVTKLEGKKKKRKHSSNIHSNKFEENENNTKIDDVKSNHEIAEELVNKPTHKLVNEGMKNDDSKKKKRKHNNNNNNVDVNDEKNINDNASMLDNKVVLNDPTFEETQCVEESNKKIKKKKKRSSNVDNNIVNEDADNINNTEACTLHNNGIAKEESIEEVHGTKHLKNNSKKKKMLQIT